MTFLILEGEVLKRVQGGLGFQLGKAGAIGKNILELASSLYPILDSHILLKLFYV